MYISHDKMQTVICKVSPSSPDYMKVFPVFVFYDDGSWAREMGLGYKPNYFRSEPGAVQKPRGELTLDDLNDVLTCGHY